MGLGDFQGVRDHSLQLFYCKLEGVAALGTLFLVPPFFCFFSGVAVFP